MKLFLFPNTIGKILVPISMPKYYIYIRETEEMRRYQELLLLAMASRYTILINDKKPETLEQIDSTLQILNPFELKNKHSFSYDPENKVLTSKDTIPDGKVYSIKF